MKRSFAAALSLSRGDPLSARRRASARIRQVGAHRTVRYQLPLIQQEAVSEGPVNDGWQRGRDFYSPTQLPRVLTRVFAHFRGAHGRYPNVLDPRGFNEWVVRSSFLRPLKVPESGNKLLTSAFIPEGMQEKVRCPEILWSGTRLNWSGLDRALTRGNYFLKSAHGSGMSRQFSWPLVGTEVLELSRVGAAWLECRYGFDFGEWWYSAFTPSLLVEADVGGNGFSVNCYCFKGDIGLVVLHSKATGETITLDERLQFVGQKNGYSNWRSHFGKNTLSEVINIASGVSRNIEFARIDFIVGASGEIFLGEVTFAPGRGISKRPDGVDERLGRMWSHSASA